MGKKKVDLIGMRIGTGIPIRDIIKALGVPMPSDKELIVELNNPSLNLERVTEIILLPTSNYVRQIALKKFKWLLSAMEYSIDLAQLNYLYNRLFNSKANEIVVKAINNFYLNEIQNQGQNCLDQRDGMVRILCDHRLNTATKKKIENIIIDC